VRYRFVGGPCDGQLSPDFTVKPFTGYRFDCGTHTYSFGADGLFHDTGVAAGLGFGGGVDTKQVGKAWHRLMHVFAVESAHAIRRSRAGRARLRRLSR
jgi:hypothetical protein